MFVLLRHLHQLKRRIAQPAPAARGSLALRHVDAGSCNGCEHELGAAASPYYDLQQYGLNIVASPRHADVLLVTGAITTRMAEPLRRAYGAMPEPRRVAALGDCALGCGLLASGSELAGRLEDVLQAPVAIRIPGCPPSPAAIAEHLLRVIAPGAAATPPSPDPRSKIAPSAEEPSRPSGPTRARTATAGSGSSCRVATRGPGRPSPEAPA